MILIYKVNVLKYFWSSKWSQKSCDLCVLDYRSFCFSFSSFGSLLMLETSCMGTHMPSMFFKQPGLGFEPWSSMWDLAPSALSLTAMLGDWSSAPCLKPSYYLRFSLYLSVSVGHSKDHIHIGYPYTQMEHALDLHSPKLGLRLAVTEITTSDTWLCALTGKREARGKVCDNFFNKNGTI